MKYSYVKLEFMNYVKSYAAKDTYTYYQTDLAIFESWFVPLSGSVDTPMEWFTRKRIIEYVSFLRTRNIKNTSIRTYIRAVRVFFHWCYNEGYVLEDVVLHLKLPKPDPAPVIPLTMERYAAIETSMGYSPFSLRNLCMFHLMLDCGLRLSEVVNLTCEALHPAEDYLAVIDSKNNKSRFLPVPPALFIGLVHYLDDRTSGSVFLCSDGSPITKRAVYEVFRRLKKYDPLHNVHPHLLRHTFATSYILGGGNLESLRVLMGHEDYTVTKNYIHLANQMELIGLDIYRLDPCMFRTFKLY